jgi:hypothetical protein
MMNDDDNNDRLSTVNNGYIILKGYLFIYYCLSIVNNPFE